MRNYPFRFAISIVLMLCGGAKALAGVPSAPENVRPSWLWSPVPSNHEVMLTWDAVPEAAGYNVYLWDESLQTWGAAATGLIEPRYRNAVPPPMPARYVVTAANAEGESGPSVEAVVQEGNFDNYIIAPWPGLYPGTLTATTAWISWSVAHVSGAEGMVDLSTDGSEYVTIYHQTNYQGGHGIWATNLTPLTIYWYRLTTISTNRVGYVYTNYFGTQDTNHPPVAEDLNLSTTMGFPAYVQLRGSDNSGFDPDSIETFRIVEGPTNGTLSGTLLFAWNNQADVVYTPAQNRPVEDRFWYVANDGELDSAPALVIITNIYYNSLPQGTYANYTTTNGIAIPIVLPGDDPDGDPLTFALDTNFTSVGEVSGPLTNLLYTPPPGFTGQDYVIYRVSDDGMITWVGGVVVIDVLSTNVAPVAFGQNVTVAEDSPQAITLTAQDANGDGLTFLVTAGPVHGSLSGAPPLLTYTPNANYNGSDAFSFRVNDGQVDSAPATVSLTVTTVNDAPVAYDGAVTTWEDSPVDFTLQASDVEGNPLTYTLLSGAAHGTLTGLPPNLNYTPAANYHGPDSFTFRVSDGAQFSAAAIVSISVTPVNDPPTATGASLTVPEDGYIIFGTSGSDVDGGPLTHVITVPPAHGTLTPYGTSGNNWTYQPSLNYNGQDSFTFVVNDGAVNSSAATVLFTVTAVNDAPSITNQSVTTAEDTAVDITPLAGDVDGDSLTFVLFTAPAHGSVTINGGQITYTSSANYHGPDSFEYQAHDPNGGGNTGLISVTVTPVNDAPVANTQSITVPEDVVSPTITLTGSDAEGDSLALTIVAPPSHGTLSGTPPDLTYVAAANYHGSDSFTFKASDGALDSAPATVTITVTSVNDSPSAVPQTGTTAEDTPLSLTLSGSDIDGDTLSYIIATTPAHGNLTGTVPNLIYTPAANYSGADSFTFRVNDGTVSSVIATVSLTVTAVNDAPSANGQSHTTPYNTPLALTLTGNDSEGSALTYTVLSNPANGALSGTAPNLTFTPNIGFSGNTGFTFKVNDGSLDSAAATVTITVQPATAVPAAPSGLTATAVSTSQINLAWTNNATNEDGFKIERSLNGSSWTQIGIVSRNVTTYSSTGLSANKTYYHRVRAYNVLGNSGYSASASAKTFK